MPARSRSAKSPSSGSRSRSRSKTPSRSTPSKAPAPRSKSRPPRASSARASSAPLSLLNLNTWGEPPDLSLRLSALTSRLASDRPSALTLQELFSPFSRRVVDAALGPLYHVHHGYCPLPSLPIVSHAPAVLLFFAGRLLGIGGGVLGAACVLMLPCSILMIWNLVVVKVFIPSK